MTEKARKWIDAAIILRKDSAAKVICPECNKGALKVTDVPIKEEQKKDLYLICDFCGKYNVMTMNIPD